ncbi:unnamed protein product [Calypogeia fissa]
MQERGGGAKWSRSWCMSLVIAVQVLLTFTGWAIFHQLPIFPSEDNFFGSIRSSAHFAKGGRHRHLLDFPQDGSSSSTKSSNFSDGNGITGTLIHKPYQCSKLSTGSNFTVELIISRETERVRHLKCALEKSSSRVGFLLSRKFRDRERIAYGLPTKDLSLVDESMDSSEPDGKFLRELLDSPEWEESYESEVWSQPGEYLMSFEVGNPPRMLEGIVDTGSDLAWLQCRRCTHCYEQSDPIYDPKGSSTYRELDCLDEQCESISTSFCNVFDDSCDYMYSYGDNSFTYGTLSTDTFTFQSTAEGQARGFPQIAFGCSHASSGTFTKTRADGIVALGRGALSLASQLGTQLSDRFGYCLVSRRDPRSITSPIYFGDAAVLKDPGAMYTPMVANKRHRAYYYVNMFGISVGGNRLDISPDVFAIKTSGNGGTLIDSGTTVTNLAGAAYDALLESFSAAVNNDYSGTSSETKFDLCFDVGDDSDPQFPSLVFHLEGMDLDLPQENYMLEAEDHTLCLAIDRSSDITTIIGNFQQQNFYILYDRENSRMGFQPTSCAPE